MICQDHTKGQRLLFTQASYVTLLYVDRKDRWRTRGRSCLHLSLSLSYWHSCPLLFVHAISYPSPSSLSAKSYAHTQGRQSSTNQGLALLKAHLLSSGLGSQCSELQMTKILFLSHPDCVDFVMEAWANSYNALYDSGICLIMVHVDQFTYFCHDFARSFYYFSLKCWTVFKNCIQPIQLFLEVIYVVVVLNPELLFS